jgi:hypothetical protein
MRGRRCHGAYSHINCIGDEEMAVLMISAQVSGQIPRILLDFIKLGEGEVLVTDESQTD